ncbi:sex comb on midleg-like protein 1 isoform X2 [Heterocephalus glaber]|uniref:Sex comb on midleg-like protein 1 isoform X2 n=1 Tax=Heterocephalus glaber TaxID=10181 RepID=A0AAX6RW11_HETGA|nr:sex comb on midleg-like protein 1 isoform X2 [Heterocephalus glaber]
MCTTSNEQEQFQPNIPHTEEPRQFLVVISQCQVIYDAIQLLDKKCDAIDRKVSEIQHSQVKHGWDSPKQLTRQSFSDLERAEAEEMERIEHFTSFSHSESYSPSSPVRRPEDSGEENMMPFLDYEESQEIEQEPLQEEEPVCGGSPVPNQCCGRTHCTCVRYPDMPASPRYPDSNSMSPTEISTISHSPTLTQRYSGLKRNLDMSSSSGCPESKHPRTSFQYSADFATSSPIESKTDTVKHTFPENPLNWSVEDVIQFLNHTDPQISGSLTWLLRTQEIDGKALMLLNNDIIIKYMGLKLGPALKLCHYIEKLKENQGVFRNVN